MKNSGAARVIGVFVLLVLATQSPVAWAVTWLAAQDAADHIGEVATVCGTVASTNFATRSKGQPTYLNLDRPYPNQVFTILIWGSDRPKFGTPETTLMGKRVCATGAIKEYRGKPEIVATDPRQLTMQ
jgi:hypothetical protein